MLIDVAMIEIYKYFDKLIEYKYVIGFFVENFIDFQYNLFIVVEDPEELGEPLVRAMKANIDVVTNPSMDANAAAIDGDGEMISKFVQLIKKYIMK